MDLRAVGATLDANDPELMADFWQAALGFKNRGGDGDPFITLSESEIGRPLNHLTIQRVPEPRKAKHRLHLDLFVSDDVEAIRDLQRLGASILVPTLGPGYNDMMVTVMADPEGGEFCVVCRR
jgi:hypothetical protein